MPKLGAADIDAVYLGGSVVDKIYLGSSAVYTAISPPDAPTNVAITVEEDYAAPSQVTGLAVDSTGDGTIDLSWSAPASEAAITDYRVEYTPSGGSATEVLVGSAATSYQLTGLTNDTEYSVRVAAISAGGQGDYSAVVTGTPVSGPVWATIAPLNSATFCGGSCGTHVSGSGTEADPYTLATSDSSWAYRWRGWVLAETSGTIRVSLPNSDHYLFAFSSVSALEAQTATPGFGLVDSLKLARGGGTFDVQVQAGQPLNIVSANYEKGSFDEWRPPAVAAAIWSY